jgi:uncharacterized protein YjbI with pentapeptide repeats
MVTISFDSSSIDLCSFTRLKLKKTLFQNSKITEADFTGCDLSDSIFKNCDLTRTMFWHTNLERTDFRSSFNFEIDPDQNRIKKAKFSLAGLAGLLGKYDIEID